MGTERNELGWGGVLGKGRVGYDLGEGRDWNEVDGVGGCPGRLGQGVEIAWLRRGIKWE